jgi:hypothetical protein
MFVLRAKAIGHAHHPPDGTMGTRFFVHPTGFCLLKACARAFEPHPRGAMGLTKGSKLHAPTKDPDGSPSKPYAWIAEPRRRTSTLHPCTKMAHAWGSEHHY